MEHRGVKYTMFQAEPDLWKWQFWIDGKTKTGKIVSRLQMLADRRVRMAIDRELRSRNSPK
jgi:hypothetical protein